MHFSTTHVLAAAALIPSSMAHYCFNKLIVDGNYTGDYEYVRKNTNSNSPVTDVTSNDLRCNVGGLESGSTTSTYKVAAGAEVGFGLDQAIGHPGPLTVYLSKAPTGSAAEYDGSGDWFKVYELGLKEVTSQGLQWASDQLQNFTFTLPSETPAGQYLMRAEHVGLHGAGTEGGAQFYISCAQLEVTSDSTATPAPTTSIPGVYTGEEPGLLINIYYPIPTNYTVAGPAVWPADGTASSSSNTTTSSNSTTPAAASSAASNYTLPAVTSATAEATTAASNYTLPAVTSTAAAETTSSITANTAVVTVSTSSGKPAYTFPASSGTAPYWPISSSAAAAATETAAYTPTGFVTATRPASSTGTATSGTAPNYGQCGGSNFSGPTTCESGWTCKAQNDYYSQCVSTEY